MSSRRESGRGPQAVSWQSSGFRKIDAFRWQENARFSVHSCKPILLLIGHSYVARRICFR